MGLVVLISVIKDGVEDWKRHRADARINSRKVRKIIPPTSTTTSRNSLGSAAHSLYKVEWQQLRVGDLLLLEGDEELPADAVALISGGVQGPVCYVETAAIDGETNLKLKQPALAAAPTQPRNEGEEPTGSLWVSADRSQVLGLPLFTLHPPTSSSPPPSSSSVFRNIRLIAEPPNGSIHRFSGALEVEYTAPFASADKGISSIPLSEKNLLLRGSVLRATEWCVCVVVYTGRETKLSQNSKQTPSKLSSVDRVVNRTLLVAISTMLLVCVVSMIFSLLWERSNGGASYLCLNSSDLSPRFSQSGGNGGCESGSTSSYLTFFTFATLYNNFVCISMYVSLEMAYLCQAFFLQQDLALYDPLSDSPAECHSSGMCADLGQVQYVLSDKTGTLTKNQMVVQRLSVGGLDFGQDVDAHHETDEKTLHSKDVDGAGDEETGQSRLLSSFVHSPMNNHNKNNNNNNNVNSRNKSTDVIQLVAASMSLNDIQRPHSDELAQRQKLDLMRTLLYCHTAMLMPDEQGQVAVSDPVSLKRCLQAESADEVALVLAAAEHCGVLLLARSDSEMRAQGLGPYGAEGDGAETVELLAVNEFDSDRKMMSVLIRLPRGTDKTGGLLLLCKGADSSVLAMCNSGSDSVGGHSSPFREQCEQHIQTYACSGLRTLVVACRYMSEQECEQWLPTYQAAKSSINQRTELLAQCARAVEKDFMLLGAVGIEDELQEGVPEAIAVLREAGLNVWMITGDKAETALAIAHKCNLVDADENERDDGDREEENNTNRPGKQQLERMVNLSGESLRQRVMALHAQLVLQPGERESQSGRRGVNTSTSPGSWLGWTATQRPPAASGLTNGREIALMVDGISLEGLWLNADLRRRFVQCVQVIPTVLACRVSPLQKAALVRMIKTAPGHPITLAIGDGANDVGMIHESRVGVGICGKEGRHAANSADFAISQFRFLVGLLFLHGRYNYIRCSKLVLYSFFKNLLLVSVLFYYCTYSGFSGTVPLDTLVFSGYNFYLGLPILAVSSLDLDIPRDSVMRYPRLAYSTGRLGKMLNIKNMAKWCLFAFAQGLILFVVTMRFISGPTSVSSGADGLFQFDMYGVGLNQQTSGSGLGVFAEGFTLYTVAVVAMQYKVVSMATTPTAIFWFLWTISFLGFVFFTFVYGLSSSIEFFNTVPLSFRSQPFWLALLLVPLLLALGDSIFESILRAVDPSEHDMLLTLLDRDTKAELAHPRQGNLDPSLRSNSMSTDSVSGVALRPMSESRATSLASQVTN
eukprot:CAMPEP_0170078792 /NCGR_PEP_ID=MMETSP0019_2-20121128/15333_1 /TAXON_ID=98059 /ORGANISM="Dinobryon sp., Strain UTEXLB2267" /LENGTH=1265 /DNA_ID=CAMNT_0010291923 /DNA_START=401 /DNA_END=4198 /DNA_ORIENTATION=+